MLFEYTVNASDTKISYVFEKMTTLQHQPPSLLTSDPPVAVNHVAPTTSDPVVRKQVVQDLMAQMQGTYNFMQVN